MNANTVLGFINGTGRNYLPLLTLAATTETAISVVTDTGTAPAFVAVPLQTAILGSSNGLGPNGNAAILVPPGGVINNTPDGNNAPFYNSGSFDYGRPFGVRIMGTGTAAANAGNTLTLKIYQGTSATLGSDTLFATPIPALATATAAGYRFYVSMVCFWDSATKILSGQISGQYLYNGAVTFITPASITPITGVNAPANLSFLASVQWGNAVGGTLQVSEFSLEQI